MKKTDDLQQRLPEHLLGYVEQLKSGDAKLTAEIRQRLSQGREAAIQHYVNTYKSHANTQMPMALVLAWPNMLGVLGLAVGVVLMLMLLMGAQKEQDALMLGDGMPIEAFVDDRFDVWSVE